jgi:hypothetical protein
MKARLAILGLHLAMFFALTFAYARFVVPLYGYEGYFFQPAEANGYLALAAVALTSLITPAAARKPSTLFYQMVQQFVVIPLLVLFHAHDERWEYPAQVLAAYAFSIVLPRYLPVGAPRFARLSKDKLLGLLFAASALYVGAIFAMGGGAYLNFDLYRVYEFRERAADNLPGLFAYVSPLIGKVAVPVAFVLALLNRRHAMAAAMLVCSFLIFGLTTHKSALFSPFLILLIYAVSSGRGLTLKLNLAVLAVILASLVDFWLQTVSDNPFYGWTGNLLVRRVFFVPAHLNYLYYDFFSRNEWVLFSNSKLTLGLLDYPYPLDTPYLIGRTYFDNDRMAANTGWAGSGYMQAGFAGLLLYAAIIGIVFKYIDACARRSGAQALTTASVVIPVYALITSGDLPTSFLTHGLYLNLLLIACFHGKENTDAHSAPEQRSLA